ncbi:Ketosteroid isomerase-related protein [Pedobacter westerhofensis]|uniref:Ketosteroid isomerase-related protein n=1 Tax=Pedobacter westerhofensis TaxID=425512 RepID=A0A521BP73_9SPHI|nr:nuclear transport factor 2 family protein [Pedobacter westerhofensis]SMO48899.1 Ketosteroid isomerase-related protein [Pedobacter westerhofensis]
MKTPGNSENEKVIRELYHVAEIQDSKAFAALFTAEGYFWDVSAGTKYYGKEVGNVVEIYATAFPDMHRELYDFYVSADENVVVVELSLNGTHQGPLRLPAGTIPATGKSINAPCCDVFHLENGKVKSFHCYTAGTILLGQLGVFGNLSAVLQ